MKRKCFYCGKMYVDNEVSHVARCPECVTKEYLTMIKRLKNRKKKQK